MRKASTTVAEMSLLAVHALSLALAVPGVFANKLGWRWAVMAFAAWLSSGAALLGWMWLAGECDNGGCSQAVQALDQALIVIAVVYWAAVAALLAGWRKPFKGVAGVLGLPAAVLFIDALFVGLS